MAIFKILVWHHERFGVKNWHLDTSSFGLHVKCNKRQFSDRASGKNVQVRFARHFNRFNSNSDFSVKVMFAGLITEADWSFVFRRFWVTQSANITFTERTELKLNRLIWLPDLIQHFSTGTNTELSFIAFHVQAKAWRV